MKVGRDDTRRGGGGSQERLRRETEGEIRRCIHLLVEIEHAR